MKQHNWSGWPGAFCLNCSAEDALENAVALNWYDLVKDIWDNEEHKLLVKRCEECKGNETT